MSLTKLSLAGNNLLFPVRESWGSDIPAEYGKIDNLFYSEGILQRCPHWTAKNLANLISRRVKTLDSKGEIL
jgi:hypothetical protein